MAQTAFSIRMDDALKREFSQFCENIGMTMSTAFVVFAKAALRNHKIPFEIYDSRISPDAQLPARVTGSEALAAFERLRAKAQAELAGKPEPSLDEINAMIAEVRKERRERRKREIAGTQA